MARSRRHNKLLFAPVHKRRTGLWMTLVILLLLTGMGILLNTESNRHPRLLRQDVTVPALPKDLEQFAILHISDLAGKRFGKEQEALKTLLHAEKFHAVCLTGDMVGVSGDASPLLELIGILPRDVPIFLIAGDDDPPPILATAHGDSQVKAPYILAAEKLGAIYLDAPFQVTVGKQAIWFCPEMLFGLDLANTVLSLQNRHDALMGAPNPYEPENGAALRAVEYQQTMLQRTQQAIAQMKREDLMVMVSHLPPDREMIALTLGGRKQEARSGNFPGRLALIMCGHLNNGQVRLPMLGALWSPASNNAAAWFPNNRLLSGLSSLQGVPLYISPGLGVSSVYPLPWRVFNKPALSILTLTIKIR